MDADTFLELLSKLRSQRSGDHRAPHKPLLLLWALGRVGTKPRLAPYEEVESAMRELLRRFGVPRTSLHPEDPYWRLRTDGLWQIPEDTSIPASKGRVPRLDALRTTSGGLPEALYERLRGDPELVWTAAQRLLAEEWQDTQHEDILDHVGLYRPGLPRSPSFRPDVLKAYEDRCAVCDFGARLADAPFGLEAAHIKPLGKGGPDEVPNGLALCSFHHKALDYGAIGLAPLRDHVVVLVSDELRGESDAFEQQLKGFAGQPLRSPQRHEAAPKPDYLAWHRQWVFKGAPREASP